MAAPTTNNLSYDDFEPYCNWHRDEDHDTLEVHLQGFKKEELKVQLNKHRILTITGERSSGENKLTRFRHRIIVSKDCKTDEIRAKLSGGILSIVMPKKTLLISSTTGMPLSPQNDQEHGPTRPKTNLDNIIKDTVTAKPTSDAINRLNGIPLKGKISKKMAVIVAVAVALLIALCAFLIYRHRRPSDVDCCTFDGSFPN